jgi:hypothetical protein
MRAERFQEQFVKWLGPDPEKGAQAVARASGYSLDYVRWAAGLRGNTPWPGSRRFIRKMRALGCTNRKWRDRSPEQIARAFETREVLYSPNGRGGGE